MKTPLIALSLLALATGGAALGAELPSMIPGRFITAPKEGWSFFFGSCSWYCGAPRIEESASSSLVEKSGLAHPAAQAHDGDMTKVWSEGVDGHGIGESLTFTFDTTVEDTTELGVTSCAIGIGHQGSQKLFAQNARPKTLELIIDGKSRAVLQLKDMMGLQQFELPKLDLARPSKHTISLKIVEVYPGTRFEDTCIAEVYFQGTGRMH
jgi:hypothetical protein